MFVPQTTLNLATAPSAPFDRIPVNVVGPSYTAVSLYSGAGGLDLGFERAGVRVLWAVDSAPAAVRTYNRNLAEVAFCADVLEIEPPEELQPDLVIGGPPCQGFSVIGRMNPNDPRSRHVEHFLDAVERLRPRGFVMENVKALATNARWQGIRDRLIDRAEELGFVTSLYVLNAMDYGVPQSRERMFLVGLRDQAPSRPSPTTRDHPPTVRQALSSLPRFGGPGNDLMCSARIVPAAKPIMRPSPYRGSLLFNGSGRPLMLDAPAKTLPASMGGNATPIIDQAELDEGRKPWVVEYHRRLLEGHPPLKRAPRRLRRITVQEAAALQSFPPHWVFSGSLVAQYRQIGNAVPPNLAEAVARSMVKALSESEDTLALARAA